MNLLRKVRIRINQKFDILLKKYRNKKLSNHNFSIICNNCWGGYVYRRYGLKYQSPTIGLYFYADDYIKLIYNLKHYFNTKLIFINKYESKWREDLLSKNINDFPIAKLDDIEVFFLHYKDEEEAKNKWNRRVQRVNYDNLIFKFSKMNLCTDEHLDAFEKFEANKKICFITKNDIMRDSSIVYKSERNSQIIDDTSEYSFYVNLKKLINSRIVKGNNYKE